MLVVAVEGIGVGDPGLVLSLTAHERHEGRALDEVPERSFDGLGDGGEDVDRPHLLVDDGLARREAGDVDDERDLTDQS